MAKERPDLNPKEIVKETCREFNADFKKTLGNSVVLGRCRVLFLTRFVVCTALTKD